MKKKTLIFSLPGLFILLLSFSIQAQITVILKQPPPNQWNVEDLWSVSLTNTTNDSLKVYLSATVEKADAGIIFEGTSASLTLEKNYSGPVYPGDLEPVDVGYTNREYEETVIKTGTLPAGNYTICVYVKSVAGDDLGHDCKIQIITHPSPPELFSPIDETIVEEDLPVFMWMPPMPLPPSEMITYNLVIYELLDGQTAIEATEANPAFYIEEDIPANSFQFPISARPFETGKTYAWKVTAISGDDWVIGESQVWSFTYGAAAVVTYGEAVPIKLISPSNGEMIDSPTPRLEWTTIDITAGPALTLTDIPTDTDIVTITDITEISYNITIWQLPESMAERVVEGYTLTEENLVDLDPYFVMEGIEGTSFIYTDTANYPLVPGFTYDWQVKAWMGDQLIETSEVRMFWFGMDITWIPELYTYNIPGVSIVAGNLVFDSIKNPNAEQKWNAIQEIDEMIKRANKLLTDEKGKIITTHGGKIVFGNEELIIKNIEELEETIENLESYKKKGKIDAKACNLRRTLLALKGARGRFSLTARDLHISEMVKWAKEAAEEARRFANEADTAAVKAKRAADNAKDEERTKGQRKYSVRVARRKAIIAQTAADNAKEAAEEARRFANEAKKYGSDQDPTEKTKNAIAEAQTAADEAQTAADEAQTAADEAQTAMEED